MENLSDPCTPYMSAIWTALHNYDSVETSTLIGVETVYTTFDSKTLSNIVHCKSPLVEKHCLWRMK